MHHLPLHGSSKYLIVHTVQTVRAWTDPCRSPTSTHLPFFARMGLAFFSKRRTLQLKPSVAPVGEAESAASRQQGALSSPSSQEQQQQQGQAERWQGPGKGSLSARWAAGSARSPSEGSDDLASVSGYCDIDSSECSGEGGAAGAAARRDCSHRFGIDYLRRVLHLGLGLAAPRAVLLGAF